MPSITSGWDGAGIDDQDLLAPDLTVEDIQGRVVEALCAPTMPDSVVELESVSPRAVIFRVTVARY